MFVQEDSTFAVKYIIICKLVSTAKCESVSHNACLTVRCSYKWTVSNNS